MNRREFVAMVPAFPTVVSASLVLREEGKEPIELDVSVLKLQPGDTLVLKSSRAISSETAQRINSVIEQRFPGMKALVLDRGIALEGILRQP